MNFVCIVCEGQTEERFVKDLLAPHLAPKQVFVYTHLLGRGNNYQKFAREVVLKAKQEPRHHITTMIDLYGMNDEFPGYKDAFQIVKEHRASHVATAIERKLSENLGNQPLLSIYVQLHEFEALLFSEPQELYNVLSLDGSIALSDIEAIRNSFPNPEHIDDSRQTAPSKRILALAPGYNKVADGFTIAKNIGLERIRTACPNFDHWLTWLESLGV